MRKVLQILSGLHRGGIETFIMNVFRNIDRTQVQFDFLLTFPGGDYEHEARELGGTLYYIPVRSSGIKAFHKSLDDFFRTHGKEYAAVHQHVSSLSSITALHYAKKYGIPVRVLHSHSSSIGEVGRDCYKPLHYILHNLSKPLVHSYATVYLGCSDKALKWLFGGTGVYRKSEMIKNGIKLADYVFSQEKRTAVRASFGLKDEIVIGNVGRFDKVKNHAFLIKIFAKILERNPEARLLLVGDGLLRPEIEKEAGEMGIIDNVIMAGLRNDVSHLLSAMDVFVMPSLYEGLPLALVEAQAAGLPIVISNRISGDVRLSGDVDVVSLHESPELWAEHVLSALKNTERTDTSQLIDSCGFGIETTVNRLMDLYLNNEARQ